MLDPWGGDVGGGPGYLGSLGLPVLQHLSVLSPQFRALDHYAFSHESPWITVSPDARRKYVL